MIAMVMFVGMLAQEGDLERVLGEQRKLHEVLDRAVPAYVFIGGGSGVCISEDGWILSNHHVAGDAGRTWQVRFAGGRKCTADVVGFDPLGDISLLRVRDGKGLPFAEPGDSDALRIGERVFAVGNPFALGNGSWEPTVTFGVVSALHRYQDWYMDAVQTDAQINPGNSGGPLFTMEGKVVGINGRIEIRRFVNRVNTGIGYAIPSNQILRYLKYFKAGGRVMHGYIEGITLGECGDDRYENTGAYGDGVFVAGIEENSPGAKAGLDIGDLLVEAGGQRCFNANRFHGIVGTYPQGETIPVRARRWNKEKKEWSEFEVSIFLGDPSKVRAADTAMGKFELGFVPAFDYPDLGVEIDRVVEGGAAAAAGLRVGDIVVQIDGRRVKSPLDLKEALALKKAGSTVQLRVLRDGEALEIPLELKEAKTEEKSLPPPFDPKKLPRKPLEEVPPDRHREEER